MSTTKKNTQFERYLGKIKLIVLPNIRSPRYRWIVRKRNDGRFLVRIPKNVVLVRDLNKKRDADFGNETLLPKGSYIFT